MAACNYCKVEATVLSIVKSLIALLHGAGPVLALVGVGPRSTFMSTLGKIVGNIRERYIAHSHWRATSVRRNTSLIVVDVL